jgi:hypothetical protein
MRESLRRALTRSRPPRVRLGAVAAVLVAAGVVSWLLVDMGGSPPKAGQPRAATVQALEALATSAGYPIYWAGLQPDTSYELTQTRLGVYIRYLPTNVRVGDEGGKHLIVATYPMKDGYTALEAVAARKGSVVTRLPRGGLAVAAAGRTKDVYLSYPGAAYQVEVYDPTPGRARALVEAGRVRPIVG